MRITGEVEVVSVAITYRVEDKFSSKRHFKIHFRFRLNNHAQHQNDDPRLLVGLIIRFSGAFTHGKVSCSYFVSGFYQKTYRMTSTALYRWRRCYDVISPRNG